MKNFSLVFSVLFFLLGITAFGASIFVKGAGHQLYTAIFSLTAAAVSYKNYQKECKTD